MDAVLKRTLLVTLIIAVIALTVFIGFGIAFELKLQRNWVRVEWAMYQPFRAVTELLIDGKASLDDLYPDLKASVNSSAAASRNTDELIHDLRAGLMGGRDSRGTVHIGTIPELSGLITELRTTAKESTQALKELTAGATAVMATAQETLKPLGTALENIARLTEDLDNAIRAGSPEVLQITKDLDKAINAFVALLDDPSIKGAIVHIESSADSVDQALMPWRRRAHTLKTVLGWIIGRFRLTYQPW